MQKCKKVRKKDAQFVVQYDTETGSQEVIADVVYNTSGRIPSIKMLDLEKGKVSHGKKGIEVTSYLQNTGKFKGICLRRCSG